MNRQRFLSVSLGLAGAAVLQACGFKLRGTQTFAFDTIAVEANPAGAVTAELRRALGNRLFVNPVTQPAVTAPVAQVTLEILQELLERAVAGVNAAQLARACLQPTCRARDVLARESTPSGRFTQVDGTMEAHRRHAAS